MCEYSGRLVAWLDGELPDEAATNVKWHLRQCAECRAAVHAYEEVSGAFLACYKAAIMPQPRRHPHIWLGSGVAVAAAIVAVLFFVQPPAQKLSIHPPEPPAPVISMRASVRESLRASLPAPVHARHRSVPAPRHRQWMVEQPVLQVALPAEALFPPGAVPPGFSFIAEVRPSE
jgi:anti-sigma factor RsiW